MNKLRLLLTEKCNRACEGCCNNDWDLDGLPAIKDYSQFDMVMLTGGEPLMFPLLLETAISSIRKKSNAIIIIYTAMCREIITFRRFLALVDGITLTLHKQADIPDFERLCEDIIPQETLNKSLRLNVFSNVKTNTVPEYWTIKIVEEWIKNCPLPKGEIFGKY